MKKIFAMMLILLPSASSYAGFLEEASVKPPQKTVGEASDVGGTTLLAVSFIGHAPGAIEFRPGRASDVKLLDALKQIAPEGWHAYLKSDKQSFNAEARVSWVGDVAWVVALDRLAVAQGFKANVDWDRKNLYITLPDSPKSEAPPPTPDSAASIPLVETKSLDTSEKVTKAASPTEPAKLSLPGESVAQVEDAVGGNNAASGEVKPAVCPYSVEKSDGTLEVALKRCVEKAGWNDVAWNYKEVYVDYRGDFCSANDSSFETAVDLLMEAQNLVGVTIGATFTPNKVLVIESDGARK